MKTIKIIFVIIIAFVSALRACAQYSTPNNPTPTTVPSTITTVPSTITPMPGTNYQYNYGSTSTAIPNNFTGTSGTYTNPSTTPTLTNNTVPNNAIPPVPNTIPNNGSGTAIPPSGTPLSPTSPPH